MAEWLSRLPAKQVSYGCAGSNPVVDDIFIKKLFKIILIILVNMDNNNIITIKTQRHNTYYNRLYTIYYYYNYYLSTINNKQIIIYMPKTPLDFNKKNTISYDKCIQLLQNIEYLNKKAIRKGINVKIL